MAALHKADEKEFDLSLDCLNHDVVFHDDDDEMMR